MPYDSNGNFSLAPGYLAVAGQVIQPSQHNPPLEDIVGAGLSNVLVRDGRAPMTGALAMGGFKITNLLNGTNPQDAISKSQLDAVSTVANGAAQALQPTIDVASAATTDLGAVASQNVRVTGTTTITSFGTVAAGTFRRLVFSGILTLTHNATSLILPQGGNVATAAGDTLEAVSLGAGNWRVTSYQRVGSALTSGATVTASGTSIDFLSIPPWVKQITVVIESLSTNGTAFPLFQMGDSGGVETTGYIATGIACAATNVVAGVTSVAGFIVQSGGPSNVLSGCITFSLLDAATNRWSVTGSLVVNASVTILLMTGTKALSATLDRVRITTTNGTDAFDGGTANIIYQ